MNMNLICFQENLSLKLSLCARQLQPKEETQPWDWPCWTAQAAREERR